MEARNCRPVLGMATLGVSLVLGTFATARAQYATGPIPESQAAMLQPTMTPPVVAAGGVQPFVQGRPGANGAAMHGAAGRGMMAGGPAAGHSGGQSENFIVLCNDPQLTEIVSEAAERFRRELAIHWLGYELPPWSRRCPIYVTAGANLGAGGETQFALYNGNVGDWKMSVQGTPERILDSVLPHEITHTLLASHFAPLNAHVPRWADEGACTTVEHSSEQNKHKAHLVQFLSTGRGLSFNRMFSLKDYPRDILPLYAQGHSVVEFLIAQSGPREFVKFLEDGMKTQQWEAAIKRAYGYDTMGQLQIKWNQWIADGRTSVEKYAGRPKAAAATVGTLAANTRPADAPVDIPAEADDAAAAEDVAEGSSIQLMTHEKDAAPAALGTKPSMNLEPAESLAAPAHTDLVSAAGTAGLQRESEQASEGFYRKRLESTMRDIVRVPASNSAAPVSAGLLSAGPLARTAALDRNPIGKGSLVVEQVSSRATARPQDPQSTPTRVIDWGKGAPSSGQQPIYR